MKSGEEMEISSEKMILKDRERKALVWHFGKKSYLMK